jgi:hypothetical protein
MPAEAHAWAPVLGFLPLGALTACWGQIGLITHDISSFRYRVL